MTTFLFLTSFSVIYLQIALIRVFSNTYYGALTYFIISLALIGFGASGTFIAIFRKKLVNFEKVILLLSFFYFLSIPFALITANQISLNLLYLLYDLRQLLLLSLFSFLLFIPFFFSGFLIGFILINKTEEREFYYGINLTGSGAGGLGALFIMFYLDPILMPIFAMVPAAAALIFILIRLKIKYSKLFTAAILISSFLIIYFVPTGKIDQYKDLYQFQLLEEQGDAHFVSSRLSPYGKIEAWSSSKSHSTLFAGLENVETAPPQLSLFLDGDYMASLFQINSKSEAKILDFTIQSLPYRTMKEPHVLLIGDAGLVNLWLALRYGAASVTVLLPDKSLKDFLEKNLYEWTSQLKDLPNVRIIAKDYRQFLISNKNKFDIIQFASAESLKGSMSGLYTFQENYILTEEAFAIAWHSLTDRGLIALSRGKQLPSKDNLKLFLTFYKTARNLKLGEPERHLFQLSNYLASISLFSKKMMNPELTEEFQKGAQDLFLEINHYPGGKYEYDKLIDQWIFDVRPSEDNRPFFNSFFRWKSLKNFYNLYGPYWFRQSDLGYLILLVTFVIILLLAFPSILLPHLIKKNTIKSPFIFYFPMIGFSFMFLEMVFIQKMNLFLGNSSISVPLVLTSLLVCSGIGSIVQKKVNLIFQKKLILAITFISVIILTILIFSDQIIYINSILAKSSVILSWIFMLLLCGATGFFMGWFFAPALSFLEKINKDSLPVAWAMNGFASVAASPLAVLLSISSGFILPASTALIFYILALFIYKYSNRILCK